MQGQNNTGYNRVMSNAGHNQGMNNNGHVPGMTYTGQYQGVTNTGHNQGMNNNRHVQGMTYTGYNNINPGVSNTGQIQRTINTGQLPPTNTSGPHPSMNSILDMVPMDQALNAARHAYGSHSEYDQHSISPDFSATACPTSFALNSHTLSMDPSLWATNMSYEMPPPPQLPPQLPLQMPTYYQPTLTPTSMVGPNPVVSRSMGLNPGLPPNNQTRGRKRGPAETGGDENGPPTKRRR
jgi:hypothetical protein